MSEQEEMDALLHRSMGAFPTPGLSSTFDQRLARRIRPRRLSRSGRVTLIVYSLLAIVLSIGLMRSKSMQWLPIAIATLMPLIVVVAYHFRYRRADSR
jgi:hypothetical protein